MGRWLDKLASGSRLVWLNDTAYTTRVLMNGAVSWTHPAAVVQWRRNALQLLNPDVAVLDILVAARGWAQSQGTQSSTVLSWVHADREFASYVGDLIRALRASTDKPLALEMPSPRKWLAISLGLAADQLMGEDDLIEDTAADIARFLRLQGNAGVDVILLHEADDPDPDKRIEAALACYASLFNTARHFRWDLGIHLPRPCSLPPKRFDYVIAPRGATGIDLPEAFWYGATAPPLAPGSFYYAEIPEKAEPSEVLARLRSLR
jgi:hypothetical protein